MVSSLLLFISFFRSLQFERDKKSKGNDGAHSIGHTIGLDEVLSSLSTSEFLDEQVEYKNIYKKNCICENLEKVHNQPVILALKLTERLRWIYRALYLVTYLKSIKLR